MKGKTIFKRGFLAFLATTFLFLNFLPFAFANSLDDYFTGAYCSVKGSKIYIGNIAINGNYYMTEWQLDINTLQYNLTSYSLQNGSNLFLNLKELYSRAFNIEVLDPEDPQLSDFDTNGCKEVWKYYCSSCYANRFLCFTSTNYRLIGMIFNNGVKLITLEAEGLPIYLADNSIKMERIKLKKVFGNNEISFEATTAISAKVLNGKWIVDLFFSGPSNGFGNITKFEYDPNTGNVGIYRVGGPFQQ